MARLGARRSHPFSRLFFMTPFVHALTLGLFAVLLFWIGWRERASNNARDGWLLFFFGAVALLLAVFAALIV